MTSKRCPTCGVTKPLDGFYRNKSRKNGRSDQCKECRRASARSYYWSAQEDVKARHEAYQGNNREKINAYQRAYHFANREKRNASRRERYEMIGDPYRDKCNEISKKHATRTGEPWSETEDNFIINSTDPTIHVAFALQRSYKAVQRRRERLIKDGRLARSREFTS